MSQQPDNELDEILEAIEIDSKMDADDDGHYWIKGRPEAKQRLLAWRYKAVREARIDELELVISVMEIWSLHDIGAYKALALVKELAQLQDNQPKDRI